MYREFKPIESATKNQNVAVEPETISKNGASLKSQMSRVNFLNLK